DRCPRSGPTLLRNPARSPLLLRNHHRLAQHPQSLSAKLPLRRRTRHLLHCSVKQLPCSRDPSVDAINWLASTRDNIQRLFKTTRDRPASSYLLVRTALSGIAAIIRASVPVVTLQRLMLATTHNVA